MKDYSRIIGKVTSTPWMITPEALTFMLELLDAHIDGRITQAEINARMAAVEQRDRSYKNSVGRIGTLQLVGPIFPKANLMTDMSGATSLEQFREDFRALMADDNVEGILLEVDSPGGASDQVEEMANEIFESRGIKPIWAIANTSMYSAAAYIALQADKVFSTPSGGVGSIGTYTVHTDDSERLKNLGVNKTIIKAGRFKAISEEPLTPDSKQHVQTYVDEVNDRFLNNVARARDKSVEYVRTQFGEGGILTPQSALKVGMIDGIQTIEQVISEMKGGESAPATPVGVSNMHTATISSSTVITTNTTKQSYDADKEHSEPGTGQGGEPTPRETPDDPAIKGGWRRDTPPIAKENQQMNREWLEQRATALSVEFDDETSDDDLAQLVSDRVDEVVVPIRNATADAARRLQFAEEYPDEAKRLERLESRDRENESHMFAESYARLEDGNALAPAVREKIQDAHMKVSDRMFTHTDLKELIDSAISQTAKVPMSEAGSSREREITKVRPDANMKEVRNQFFDLVKNKMTEDSLSMEDAIAQVSQLEPELAAAYLNAR